MLASERASTSCLSCSTNRARLAAFLEALQQLGWIVGRNIHIDNHWGGGSPGKKIRNHAMELAALAPDIILADGAPTVGPMLQAKHATISGMQLCVISTGIC